MTGRKVMRNKQKKEETRKSKCVFCIQNNMGSAPLFVLYNSPLQRLVSLITKNSVKDMG